MKLIKLLAITLLFLKSSAVYLMAEQAPGKPYVLLVTIDGLRPDLIYRADARAILQLMKNGSFTLFAQTTASADTLPSHASIYTGVEPAKHGVLGNTLVEQTAHSRVPTLFAVAQANGSESILAAGKEKFRVFIDNGFPTTFYVGNQLCVPDSEVVTQLRTLISQKRPELVVVHLGAVDIAGHDFGWGSPQQLDAVRSADAALQDILNLFSDVRERTYVILTADHGGARRGHGRLAFTHIVPWIIEGPGVRRNSDLTLVLQAPLKVEDTFSTICRILHWPAGTVDGRAVTEAFENNPAQQTTSK